MGVCMHATCTWLLNTEESNSTIFSITTKWGTKGTHAKGILRIEHVKNMVNQSVEGAATFEAQWREERECVCHRRLLWRAPESNNNLWATVGRPIIIMIHWPSPILFFQLFHSLNIWPKKKITKPCIIIKCLQCCIEAGQCRTHTKIMLSHRL